MSDEEERLKHWHSSPFEEEDIESQAVSEYGKGLMVCLAKWFQHFGDRRYFNLMCLHEYIEKDERGREGYYNNMEPHLQASITFFLESSSSVFGNEERAFANEIMMWANAASDHLYEIEVPDGVYWDEVRQLVKELQDKGLDMGHGAGLTGRISYTWGDVEELLNLTQKIMIKVDGILGLQPDWGSY